MPYFVLKYLFLFKRLCYLVLKHLHLSLWLSWQRNRNYADLLKYQGSIKNLYLLLSISDFLQNFVYSIFVQTKLKQ